MNPSCLGGGVGEEGRVSGIIGEKAKEDKESDGKEKNPYTLSLDFLFERIFNHGSSHPSSLK